MTQPTKETKYNYLQHSFDRELQRSYDRKQSNPPSPSIESPNLQSPTQKDRYQKYHQAYNDLSRERSPMRSSEFSPYENKEENVREKILVQELKNHNRVLNDQIEEYKIMLDKMQVELRVRAEDFAALELVRQKERAVHDQALKEMKEEIGILLTKNSYLEERNIILEREVKKYECQITKNEAKTRSLSAVAANSKSSASKLLQEIWSILQNTSTTQKPRQHGKLLNQTGSNLQSLSPSSSVPQSPHLSENYVINELQSLVNRMRKFEELTQSISEMHLKIKGKRLSSSQNGSPELKLVWKWLKQLGHNYNMVQKWKKMLVDLLHLPDHNNGQEWTIEDVLQKTVLQLHVK